MSLYLTDKEFAFLIREFTSHDEAYYNAFYTKVERGAIESIVMKCKKEMSFRESKRSTMKPGERLKGEMAV